jgi:D-alanyl-D-alanine carboxypeptidase/D-alanyl-D-alanine-endopeptidase (penicillin-binding protein 4)
MIADEGRRSRRSLRARGPACALLAIALGAGGCRHAVPAVAPASPAARPAAAAAAIPVAGSPRSLEALQHDIDAILAAPALERGYWGVIVESLDTHDVLYARNARKLMMPASTMKIVTLATTAERLGWEYRYDTRLLAGGPIAAGTLDGDLIVVGSGDPSLTEATADAVFASWADALKTQGVTSVSGRLIGDDRALDPEPLGMGWSWDDLPDGYAAGVGALQFNEDMARVTIAPGAAVGAPATIVLAPAAAELTVENHMTTVPAGGVSSFETHRKPGSALLELRGSVPLGAAARVHTVSVDNPTRFFVEALKRALIASGVAVRGAAVDIDDIAEPAATEHMPALVSYQSAPLSILAARLMKTSQNQYAETLLRTLGAAGGVPTAANGAATAASILQEWGVPAGGLIQRDGSGLSRYDYVSPETLAAILAHVDGDVTLRAPFEAALPIAGRDGTLSNRMKGTAAEGNARAKTGSMSNVRALCGYVTSASGERLVFSILANNFEASADVVDGATDAIVVELAQFGRSPQRH